MHITIHQGQCINNLRIIVVFYFTWIDSNVYVKHIMQLSQHIYSQCKNIFVERIVPLFFSLNHHHFRIYSYFGCPMQSINGFRVNQKISVEDLLRFSFSVFDSTTVSKYCHYNLIRTKKVEIAFSTKLYSITWKSSKTAITNISWH